MPTRNEDAEVFIEHRGVKIYYVYKNDDLECGITRFFSYSLDPDSRDQGDGAEYQSFDISELDAWKVATTRNSQQTPDTAEKVLRLAIDNGELNELIADAINEGGVEIDVLAWCGNCDAATEDTGQLGSTCFKCKRGSLEVKIRDSVPCPKCGVDLPASGKCVSHDCNRVEAKPSRSDWMCVHGCTDSDLDDVSVIRDDEEMHHTVRCSRCQRETVLLYNLTFYNAVTPEEYANGENDAR